MTASVGTRDIALTAAEHEFGIRVYPAGTPTGELLVWLHGGAFMFGDLEMPEADATARGLAENGITVISADYTLAPLDAVAELPPMEAVGDFPLPDMLGVTSDRPRARFPVASLQTVAAFDWALDHAADFGADQRRVAIGGASAGGNIAGGAALRIRDSRDRQPMAQVLVYPVLHAVLPEADDELRARLADLPAWMRFPPETTRALNENYLGGADADSYAFPASDSGRGAAPALIVAAESDELRPSAADYAEQLANAGVPVEYVVEVGATHGFLNMPGHPSQIATIEHMTRFLRERENA